MDIKELERRRKIQGDPTHIDLITDEEIEFFKKETEKGLKVEKTNEKTFTDLTKKIPESKQPQTEQIHVDDDDGFSSGDDDFMDVGDD